MDYDTRDMLVSSDYPSEKIISYKQGSFSYSNMDFNPVVVPHDLSFAPLCLTQWSNSSDFVPTFSETYFLYMSGNNSLSVMSDSNNLYFLPNTISSATFYYRVFMFTQPGTNPTTSPSSSLFDDFVYNTDYSYPKVFLEGALANRTGTINHGLGYVPQVEVWGRRALDSRIMRIPTLTNFSSKELGSYIDSNNLILISDSSPGTDVTTWFYRIFTDEF